jgi:hypothetical protein
MGRCNNCKRLRADGQCAVLTELIGKEKDCAFWTNDPNWAEKAEAAINDYAKLHGSKVIVNLG